jgi:hypothetical protein
VERKTVRTLNAISPKSAPFGSHPFLKATRNTGENSPPGELLQTDRIAPVKTARMPFIIDLLALSHYFFSLTLKLFPTSISGSGMSDIVNIDLNFVDDCAVRRGTLRIEQCIHCCYQAASIISSIPNQVTRDTCLMMASNVAAASTN